jgi:hypothetical protein
VGELADRLPARPVDKLTPAYRNITARNIIVEKSRTFVDITGISESPAANLLIENADVNARSAFKASDAKEITLRNVSISMTDSLLRGLDIRNVLFEKVIFKIPGNNYAMEVKGDNSKNIRFVDCLPSRPEGWE